MLKTNTQVSDSISSTAKIALEFAKSLENNCIIYLNGDVGSGKTIFTNKVASYFGNHTITSSSFSRIQLHRGFPNIIHCDLYRGVFTSAQLLLELETHLVEPWLLFIEWPNETLSIPNSCQYVVNIDIISLENRTFSFEQII